MVGIEKGRRRRLSKEVREEQILKAAGELFWEKGYANTSTLEIAQKADVVEGTIFRYFATKHDLMLRVAERAYNDTISDYDVNLEGITGTWNRLRFLAWRHLKSISDRPEIHTLVQYEIRLSPDYRGSTIYHLNRTYTRRTTDIIEEAIRNGEFIPSIPTRVVRDVIYGGIEHLVWRYVRGEGPINIEETADHLTNLIYYGLVARNEAPVVVQEPAGNSEILLRIEERLRRIEERLDQTPPASQA